MGWHITRDTDWVGPWVAQRVGGTNWTNAVALGLARNDSLVAGVLYEQWNGRSIFAHVAIDGRMTPAYVAAIFDYPFNVCGANKVICPVFGDNLRSARLATHMGFTQEAVIRDAAPAGDILIFTLEKSNCRFLKERYGKQISARAPASA